MEQYTNHIFVKLREYSNKNTAHTNMHHKKHEQAWVGTHDSSHCFHSAHPITLALFLNLFPILLLNPHPGGLNPTRTHETSYASSPQLSCHSLVSNKLRALLFFVNIRSKIQASFIPIERSGVWPSVYVARPHRACAAAPTRQRKQLGMLPTRAGEMEKGTSWRGAGGQPSVQNQGGTTRSFPCKILRDRAED
jgi:hypothetical protein